MTTKQGVVQVKSADGRRISFIASHEKVDRDGEVVLIAGIDTTEFQRNPVLCLQHQSQQTAVARVENLRRTRIDGAAALIGDAVFPDRPASNEVLADVKAGLLSAVSIGFKVQERGAPILPDQHGVTYLKTSLLEISLVTLPACPTCLVTSKSAGCSCASKNALDRQELPFVNGELRFEDEDEFVTQSPAMIVRLTREVTATVLRTAIPKLIRQEIRYHKGLID